MCTVFDPVDTDKKMQNLRVAEILKSGIGCDRVYTLYLHGGKRCARFLTPQTPIKKCKISE